MLRTSSSVTHITASGVGDAGHVQRVLAVAVPGEVVDAPPLQVLLLGGVGIGVDDDHALAGVRELADDAAADAVEAEDHDVLPEGAALRHSAVPVITTPPGSATDD